MADLSIDSVLERYNLGSYRWSIYAACGILIAVEGYDAYIVSILAPVIARGLNIPIPAMGFVFTAQAAGMALGYYTLPMLADRIGRRGIIVLGSLFFALFTFASTLATDLQSFTAVRFLAFAALGGTMPNIVALVTEFVPSARRGQLITWLFITHGLGASVAGLSGPTFVALHSWKLSLWIGGAVLLLLVPFLYLYLPESCRFLLNRNPQDPRIARTLRRIEPGLVAPDGTRFTTVEHKAEGLPLAGLFREGRAPMTILLWIAMGSAMCVTQTLTAWSSTYLNVLCGLPIALATRMSALGALGAIAGPVLLTALMKRFGLSLALATILTIGFVTMSAHALVPEWQSLGWALGACFGLFLIGAQAGLNSLVASSYPTSVRSTGIGWAGGIGRITSMIGPALGGVMLAAGWNAWQVYPTVSAPLLAAAIAMLVFHMIKASAGQAKEVPAQAGAQPLQPVGGH
jgi:AAHS family 4-hydroxybenzoate transporter-like MFS transporter